MTDGEQQLVSRSPAAGMKAGPRRHDRPAGPTRSREEPVDAILQALAGDPALGPGPWVQFRPARVAGRSSIVFVQTAASGDGRSRLVVKRSRVDWRQDDLASPVLAAQEFEALVRLRNAGVRVPRPVQLLPEIGAFAMEYVPGRSLRDLFRYSSVLRPAQLLEGLTRTAEFLRQVHALETFPDRFLDLAAEAEAVLALAEQRLQPVGLALPRRVTEVLQQVPRVMVNTRQVWLHGDFGPTNIILAEDGSTVGIDAALDTVGAPEEDLVRFIALMSGAIRFAPEVVAPPVSWLRRRLVRQLLCGYYGTTSYPPLFELRLIDQLARRWLRLRELARQDERRALLPMRLRVIEAQVRLLTDESAQRLMQSIGG